MTEATITNLRPEETPTVTPVSDIRPGTIVTADNPNGRRVWLYVVVPTGPDTAYGVNLGASLGTSVYLGTDCGTGPAWITGTDIRPQHGARTLGDLSQPQTEALASFLRSHGLTLSTKPTSGSGDEFPEALVERVKRETEQRLTERFESWKSSLVSDAHEFADENNLCGEFDRFMREHDLPEREREYAVNYSVTLSGTVYVTGSGRDDVAERFESGEWTEHIGSNRLSEYAWSADVTVDATAMLEDFGLV